MSALKVQMEQARSLLDAHDFLDWLISLDDDDPDSPGRIDRRTVTLTQIIKKARIARGEQ